MFNGGRAFATNHSPAASPDRYPDQTTPLTLACYSPSLVCAIPPPLFVRRPALRVSAFPPLSCLRGMPLLDRAGGLAEFTANELRGMVRAIFQPSAERERVLSSFKNRLF